MLELPEARALMAEILQSSPDTKFTDVASCVYFNDDGSPCCAVGYVFSNLHITREDLAARLDWQNPNTTTIMGLWPTWKDKISNGAADFLNEVQALQDDSGLSWGEIFEELYGEANGED